MGMFDLGASEAVEKQKEVEKTKKQRLDEITGKGTMLEAGVTPSEDDKYFAEKDAGCLASHGEGYQWNDEAGTEGMCVPVD